MPKVLIVGNDALIAKMFLKRGWQLVDYLGGDPDLVQFTGGEDVDPSYYKEGKHPSTYSNPRRDAQEASIYNDMLGKVPMAGICRGAQFLNVMNGGKLWQHVNYHATMHGHMASCHHTGQELVVTSTHHQMMIPTDFARVLLTANIAEVKQGYDTQEVGGIKPDVEAVFYDQSKSLCYQPHPEYVTINSPCQNLYFQYIKDLLGLDADPI